MHVLRATDSPRGANRKAPLGYEQAISSARLLNPGQSQRVVQDPSVTILDVGASPDYKTAHLPGAKWISRGWLELKLPNRLLGKGTPILITCPDGRQSAFAARTVATLGYANVSVLEGGVNAWRAAGYPLESGMTACLSEANDVVVSPSITGDKAEMQRYLDWEEKLVH
jgi:rhodanese-related sulfurtransferase